MKTCIKCNQEQDDKEFRKPWGNICRLCRNDINKAYYRRNLEEARKRWKKYKHDNEEKWLLGARKNRLKKLYGGATLEDYNDLYNKQEGRCAICKIHQSELKKSLAVDHNHKTMKIRGLLCDKCNRGLGYFNDSLDNAERLVIYLKNNI